MQGRGQRQPCAHVRLAPDALRVKLEGMTDERRYRDDEVAAIFEIAAAPGAARRMTNEKQVTWDLRNDEGTRVAPGVYLLVARAGGHLIRRRLIVF